MKMTDFFNLTYFKPNEVLTKCEIIDKLDYNVIYFLDELRLRICKPIHILSLTGGEHEANSLHYEGKAVDFFTIADPSLVLKHALSIGFRGFGLYTNEKGVHSFHCDIREEYSFWRAVKKDGKWCYSGLL